MAKKENTIYNETNEVMSCLRNEQIIVRYLPRATYMVQNPKHVLYGGLALGAFRDFVVPIYPSNGAYKNVLTNDEKRFLEEYMGLEEGALSIHKKTDNFWNNFSVRLTKEDTILNLADPMDYIKYKVLLCNSLYVASSLAELEDNPKATYQFVLIKENEESASNMKKLNYSMESYMLLGQFKNDLNTLRVLLELLEGRPISQKISEDACMAKLQTHIQENAKLFVKTATDKLLPAKVLIKRCVEEKFIAKRGNYYYLASSNEPLCNANQEPVLNVAAAYLMDPKNQELRFSLEEKIK